MRKAETSTIKLFIDYARSKGCTWEDYKFYSELSILCNLGVGLPRKNGRNFATKEQLIALSTLEGITIINVLNQGMAEGLHWTQIWAKIQQQVQFYLNVVFQGRSIGEPENCQSVILH